MSENIESILRALPGHLPVSVEVPTQRWAQTTCAVDRARRQHEAARAGIEQACGSAT